MNHRRNTSRRRRSSASKRRGGRGKRAARALAAGAAIAAGTQTYADWIRFDNPAPGDPGHFSWRGPLGTETWLDITQSVADQTGLPSGPGSIGQVEYPGFGWLEGYAGAAELGVGGVQDWFLVQAPVYLGYPYMQVPVPGIDAWASWGFAYYSGYGSELPEFPVPTYVAARFDPGDGMHYGWVGVVRYGTGLEPFTWGYNTDPVPEPGTLSMLALGAAAVTARRRRGRRG